MNYTDPDLWATIFAPVLTSALVLLGAGGLGSLIRWHRDRIARRWQIVSIMGQATALLQRAVRDGQYEQAWIADSGSPLAAVLERYDDLTVEALTLFTPGEFEVAFWAAVEFYAGFLDPLLLLESYATPRQPSADGFPLLSRDGEGPSRAEWLEGYGPAGMLSYTFPRSADLLDWARGRGKGPRFAGDVFNPGGDDYRHYLVKPNSGVPGGMILPPAWLYKQPRPNDLRGRKRE